jgi:hypothetical protein
MKNFFSTFFLIILVFLCLSCGKKGQILPPLVRFPQSAEDVQVVQKADRIILTWRNPVAYDDGSALPAIREIEIWVYERRAAEETEMPEIQEEEFQQKARLQATIEKDQISAYLDEDKAPEGWMRYAYDLSGEDSLSNVYTFSLRVKDKKRHSPFSVLVSLKPMVLPLPPTEVKAAVFPDRIAQNRDRSSPPNLKGYNVYRSEEDGRPRRLNPGLVKGEKYEDKDFVFEKSYKYIVRASATDISPYLESEDSEEIEILTRDTFAPEPPKGLVSVAGQDVLAISWDANTEGDLDGYRVWRREQEANKFRLLTPDPIKENAYNDKTAEIGKMYVYAVTALDRAGNESQKSKPISDIIRERME